MVGESWCDSSVGEGDTAGPRAALGGAAAELTGDRTLLCPSPVLRSLDTAVQRLGTGREETPPGHQLPRVPVKEGTSRALSQKMTGSTVPEPDSRGGCWRGMHYATFTARKFTFLIAFCNSHLRVSSQSSPSLGVGCGRPEGTTEGEGEVWHLGLRNANRGLHPGRVLMPW